MINSWKRDHWFSLITTAALLLPLAVGLSVSQSDDKRVKGLFPHSIGQWQAQDLSLSNDIVKNYAPLDNRLTWRRYNKKNSPFVECIIQEATNHENLHDLYMCLVYSKTAPKRIQLITTPGKTGQKSAIYQFQNNKQSYVTLFCYQTRQGFAIYPPTNFDEKLKLLILGRKPCRLIEIATPVKDCNATAIKRLKEVATGICSTPL